MQIIVTGDDFGKSEDVNNAIELSHDAGILTSASLLATGAAFGGAVNISRRHPALGIGVHLAIDEFDCIFEHQSSIKNPLTNNFYPLEIAIKKLKKFQYRCTDLINEYCLQIEKVLDSGISITHLDHHHHLHLYWPVLNAMISVAKKYNIRYIRSERLLLQRKPMLYKSIYRFAHQLYLRRRLATTDGYFEFACVQFDEMYERLIRLINSNYKLVEIMVHPCSEKEHEVSFLTNEKVVQLKKSYDFINFQTI
jgi:predicted glycoside hydrolase/deacetylase ChbG (UPF0249 family)